MKKRDEKKIGRWATIPAKPSVTSTPAQPPTCYQFPYVCLYTHQHTAALSKHRSSPTHTHTTKIQERKDQPTNVSSEGKNTKITTITHVKSSLPGEMARQVVTLPEVFWWLTRLRISALSRILSPPPPCWAYRQ